jgi:hypothetical protein
MSNFGARAVFESGLINDAYSDVKTTDVVLKTLLSTDNIIFANAPENDQNPPYSLEAALYLASNRVGIKKIPTDGADLDVRGTLACCDKGVVLYRSDRPQDVLNRTGDCVAASHSNISVSRDGFTTIHLDNRGNVAAEALLGSEHMVPLYKNESISLRSFQVLNASDPETKTISVVFNIDNATSNAPSFDCSSAGDVLSIGNSVYELTRDAIVDISNGSLQVQMRNLSHDSFGTYVDPAIVNAANVVSGGSGSPIDVSRYRRVASIPKQQQQQNNDIQRFESEGGQYGSFSLRSFGFVSKAADTQVDIENGYLVLSFDNEHYWRARLMRRKFLAVGYSIGVFFVEDVFNVLQGTQQYKMRLFPIDGSQSSILLQRAFDAFSSAINSADDTAMPEFHPCQVDPSPDDLVITQVQASFSSSFKRFEIALDVYSEPLSRLLNHEDDVANGGGNLVRAIRFVNVSDSKEIPITASYITDTSVVLVTNDTGAQTFSALAYDPSSASSSDIACVLTGYAFRVTDVSAVSSHHIAIQGEQFTRASTKTAVRRIRYRDSSLRSRGDVHAVVSDGNRTEQWTLCYHNDDVNKLVLRKRNGNMILSSDLLTTSRFVYIIPVITPQPTTVSNEDQPAGLVLHSSLCVGSSETCPPRQTVDGDVLNVFGNAFIEGSLSLAHPAVGEAWRAEVSSDGTLKFKHGHDITAMTLSDTEISFKQDLRTSANVYATRFNSTSDARLKENIVPLDDNLAKFMSIPLKQFSYVEEEDEDETPPLMRTGLLAQNLSESFPSCVSKIRGFVPIRPKIVLKFDKYGRALLDDVNPFVDITKGDVFSVVSITHDPAKISSSTTIRITFSSKEAEAEEGEEEEVLKKMPLSCYVKAAFINGEEVTNAVVSLVSRLCDDVHVVDNGELLFQTMGALQSLARIVLTSTLK